MVFVEPSKSINVQGLWLDIKRNQFFILQRHRAAETALGSSLQLMRSMIGPASGADGYRIIASASPYYQVASTFDLLEILQDWGWIEEHLMPLAERMEGRDFRILVVKYFSDLAHGKHTHLPRSGSVHADLNRLDKQELEEPRKDVPDEEEIAVLGPDNSDEEDAIDEVDLDTDDTMSPRSTDNADEWIDKIIRTDADASADSMKTSGEVAALAFSENAPRTGASESDTVQLNLQEASGAENGESLIEWPGLRSMPEQYTHPESAFDWLRTMARGTEDDGWRYVDEEAGVTFYRKEIEGPGGKHDIYKGVVVIDATAKSVFDTINKADKWPKWDRTLSKVQVLDRLDQKNEIVHMHVRKFFPSFSSFAQAVNMSKRAEKERDMVVFKSWGIQERDSYVLYLRSVDYDKLEPETGVIRMETDGCGFLIEPMSSIFPSSAFRSPLAQSSSLAGASIVSFVSDINWKGWLTPIMGEYVHFTKVMLLKEIKNSFAPDLAFVGRRSTTNLPTPEDDEQDAQQYSLQSAMKGFTSFLEGRKKRMAEERERKAERSAEVSGEEVEEEREVVGMLDKFRAMLEKPKTSDKPNEGGAEDGESTTKSEGLWSQWKQALTLKTSPPTSERTPDDEESIATTSAPTTTATTAATATGPTPTPTPAPATSGWLTRVKGALAKNETAPGGSPVAAATAAGETKKGWFGRAAGSPEPTSAAPVETGNGSAQSTWSSGWLNRVKDSVVLATTAKKAEPSASKEGVELKTMEGRARAPTTEDEYGADSSQQQEFTIKFSIVDDEHREEEEEKDGKGKEVEKQKQQHENDEETRKQQNDGSSNSVSVGNGGR